MINWSFIVCTASKTHYGIRKALVHADTRKIYVGMTLKKNWHKASIILKVLFHCYANSHWQNNIKFILLTWTTVTHRAFKLFTFITLYEFCTETMTEYEVRNKMLSFAESCWDAAEVKVHLQIKSLALWPLTSTDTDKSHFTGIFQPE